MSPDWMSEEVATLEGRMAFAKRPSPFLISRAPGKPRIIVLAKARGEVDSVFVRVPKDTMARWKRAVSGGHSVAIAAAMEMLLDEIEAESETITVDQA